MRTIPETQFWLRLLWVLFLLLPLAVLFLMPGRVVIASVIWFFVVLLLSLVAIRLLLGPAPPQIAREEMYAVNEEESPVAAPHWKRTTTAGRETRPWVHWLLFGLTLLTTTWAGAAHQGIDLLREPRRFSAGLPYALGLMAILGVHELGHYFTARHHKMKVTPPYFIPVPFALGTFGAFIQMKSPAQDRKALFDVAIAGPLAGLVIAIPALLIGLRSSTILTSAPSGTTEHMLGASVGSSVLLVLLTKISLGGAVGAGHILRLSPLAFAGWLGLFITALNLLPVGQLDGGHVSRAMFGPKVGNIISRVALWSLFLLAIFVWPGLLMWTIIVFFIAGRGTPPVEDVTPISPWRQRLGYLTFAILIAILLPLPHALWRAAGIHCPYA